MKKVQIFKLKKKVNFETGQNRPKKFANVIYLTYPTMSKNISLENRLELKKISILSFKKRIKFIFVEMTEEITVSTSELLKCSFYQKSDTQRDVCLALSTEQDTEWREKTLQSGAKIRSEFYLIFYKVNIMNLGYF